MGKNVQTKTEQKEQRKVGFFQTAKARLFVMMMVCMSIMSLSAFAADGETSAATISSLLAEAGTTIPSMMSLAWNVITSNPLTTLSVIVMVAGIAFGLIRRARRAVR